MTTATHGGYSYVFDPSGADLRRALLVADEATRQNLAAVVIGAGAALTLATGLMRVVAG